MCHFFKCLWYCTLLFKNPTTSEVCSRQCLEPGHLCPCVANLIMKYDNSNASGIQLGQQRTSKLLFSLCAYSEAPQKCIITFIISTNYCNCSRSSGPNKTYHQPEMTTCACQRVQSPPAPRQQYTHLPLHAQTCLESQR